MTTGGENYKIQCLSKILSNELTTKQKKKNFFNAYNIEANFLFCTVMSRIKDVTLV